MMFGAISVDMRLLQYNEDFVRTAVLIRISFDTLFLRTYMSQLTPTESC